MFIGFMSITHCAIATAGTSLILGTASPLPLGLAIIGSQLPDLDTTTSTIGKIFFPISSWIEDRFPHRSITHCLLATAAIAIVSISIALLCFGIYLANGGGITQKVSQNLGLKDGVVELYNQNASTHQVYANITGYWASDRTSADGKYLIIGNEGNEFIVSDGKGVYKTGEQIITSKVSTVVGEVAKTEIKNLSFDDEEAIAQLSELQQTYPEAEIYLNDELAIDFPEDVKIPVEPNQMVTAEVVGSSLKFSYCELGKAIAILKDQYAVGNVEIKVVQQ